LPLKEQQGIFNSRQVELLESYQEDMVDTSIGRPPKFDSMNLDQIFEHYKTNQTTIIARINYQDILNKNYTKEYTFDIMALQKQKDIDISGKS
jgi:predicted PolB exonuclease-like 3'-5' exonuclease